MTGDSLGLGITLTSLPSFAGPLQSLAPLYYNSAHVDSYTNDEGGKTCADAVAWFTAGRMVSYAGGIQQPFVGTVWQPSTQSFYDYRRKKNVLSISCGHNDYIHGSTVLQSQADLLSLINLAKAAGFSVIVSTLMDSTVFGSGPSDPGEIWRGSWNSATSALSGISVADWGADSHLGCNGCASNSTYFTDGTHCTLTGLAIQAGYENTILSGLGFN